MDELWSHIYMAIWEVHHIFRRSQISYKYHIYIYLVSFIPWIHEYPIQIIHIIPNVLVMDYAWIILLE